MNPLGARSLGMVINPFCFRVGSRVSRAKPIGTLLRQPFWRSFACLAVVGSRKMHSLSSAWMNEHFSEYVNRTAVCIVSGGAFGVDQLAHRISIKNSAPTVVVTPSGLIDIYPSDLKEKLNCLNADLVCYLSEFEMNQVLHKSHFYFRNRLISALGDMVLVVQADCRSGSLLTVHHALENGKPVLTLPAHPSLSGFKGNFQLMQEGAGVILSSLDLQQIWLAEKQSNIIKQTFA